MKNIILFGANGKLGSAFVNQNPKIRGFSHEEADITDKEKINLIIKREKPNVIINCAALTDVDYCETHADEAWLINVRGVRNLAEAAKDTNALLVHFSSDYALHPVNEYAWTKLASEAIVHGIGGLLVRTTCYDKSFWIIRNLMEGKKMELLTNEYFNPISTQSLAGITCELIDKNVNGIINIGTKRKLSIYDFGIEACKALGADAKLIKPVTSLKFKRIAKRYPDNFLSTKELERRGMLLTIQEDLRRFKNEAVK